MLDALDGISSSLTTTNLIKESKENHFYFRNYEDLAWVVKEKVKIALIFQKTVIEGF